MQINSKIKRNVSLQFLNKFKNKQTISFQINQYLKKEKEASYFLK